MTDELNKRMYYGATPVIFEMAFKLRRNMTPSEELLWNKLKGKQILGVRFRRQHPISTYIVDFYCHAARLVVELDGKIHLTKMESDRERTKEIEDLGLRIIRFSNKEAEERIDNIVAKITSVVKDNLNSGV
jgi:very-short-patch-repair endonuclease